MRTPPNATPPHPGTAFRRRRWPGVLAVLLLLATGPACTTLDEKQGEWIFRPTREAWRGTEYATQGMQDVWIEFNSPLSTEPARLHGVWLPQPEGTRAPALLYLHGARWDVRGSAHRIRRMHELGFSVLAIDYRGFGRSSGERPSEPQAYEDARAAWAWLQQQQPQAKRFVFGHSLGGAIAVELAASVKDESGLMVEGAFTSVADVVQTYRWGWLPVGPLITQRFEAGERIAQVGSPVLVVHGSEDRVIAPELGERLYARAKAPKRFVRVEGGSHHNTHALAQPAYKQAMHDLFGLAPASAAVQAP